MKHLRIIATDEYELSKFNIMFSTDYQNYMFVNPNRAIEVDNDGIRDLENAIYKYNILRGDTTIKLQEDKK